MSALELSSDVGIVAVFVLTFNILLGLLMGVKYNPWKSWPHRRINYFRIHNWTGYVALTLSLLHVILLLLSSEAKFRLVDVLYPMVGPKQQVINTLGAAALYVLIVIVVTSYYRAEIGHDRWRRITPRSPGIRCLDAMAHSRKNGIMFRITESQPSRS